MHALIAGGSGFLGRHVTRALVDAGHHVTILSRRSAAALATAPASPGVSAVSWNPDGSIGPWAAACPNADAIVNLAGESIGSSRWSPARMALLQSSRLLPTRSLAAYTRQSARPPALFVSGSAVGYYGDAGDTPLTESSPAGHGFLAELARTWEGEAAVAASGATRVVLLRTGVVLDPHEGALARMLLPFRLGVGGPMGSGRQFVPWIHRDDWVALVLWLLATPDVSGPFNATAPEPVRNAELAATLGRVLRRPALLPTPAWVLRVVVGEMAGPLLLASQRGLPARALKRGFQFRFPALEPALIDLGLRPG
jgi:uncharacterized protein (TIGR01777 family)